MKRSWNSFEWRKRSPKYFWQFGKRKLFENYRLLRNKVIAWSFESWLIDAVSRCHPLTEYPSFSA